MVSVMVDGLSLESFPAFTVFDGGFGFVGMCPQRQVCGLVCIVHLGPDRKVGS